jgi:thymidine kinase
MDGSFTLFVGPMFSGKTDALIDAFRAEPTGVAFKPAADTRHAVDRIVSHSGESIPAVAVHDAAELLSAPGVSTRLFVDEVQFFDPSIVSVVRELRDAGVSVTAAGLNLDFRREPFDVTSSLAGLADELRLFSAVCLSCGRPAQFTQRLLNGVPASLDEPVLRVGDEELYEPRCAACWEAERGVLVAPVLTRRS